MTDRQTLALLKLVGFLLAALPGLFLAWDYLDGSIAANPYQDIIRRTGLWSMRLLILGIAVTPLASFSGWQGLVRFRRMIGLFAAAYAAVHIGAWVVDYRWDWAFLGEDILARRYLTVGAIAALGLLPLLLSSNRAAKRSLGERGWRWLHRLVYPVALLVFVHYAMAKRFDRNDLVFYGLALVLAFGWRLVRRTRTTEAAR